MTTNEEFEKETKIIIIEYLEKHVIGKDIDNILYNFSKSIIIDLTKILFSFQIKKKCLELIKNNIKDKNRKDIVNETILGINEICDKLDEILGPIAEELNKKD